MSSVPPLESPRVEGVREEIPAARDPDATIATAPVRRISANLNLEHTPVAPLVLPPPRRDTPLRPVALTPPREARATLTLLTGMPAGLLHAIDGASTTIGRSAESDLVVDEEGVSRHHARVDRTVEGAFYVEDLGSTNGTFLGADRMESRSSAAAICSSSALRSRCGLRSSIPPKSRSTAGSTNRRCTTR